MIVCSASLPSRLVRGFFATLTALLCSTATHAQLAPPLACDLAEEVHVLCIPADCQAPPHQYLDLPWGAIALQVPKFDPAKGRLWQVELESCATLEEVFCFEYLGTSPCPAPYSWQLQTIFDSIPDDFTNVPPLGPGFPTLGFVFQNAGGGPDLPAGDGVFDCTGPAATIEILSGSGCSDVITIDAASSVDLNAFVLDVTDPLDPGHVTFLQNSLAVFSLTACLPHDSDLHSAALFQLEVKYTYCPAPGVGYCFGDPGSGTHCPCGNDNDGSVPGSGCANGQGLAGARLTAAGAASVSADTLTLFTTGQGPNEAGLYFQGDSRVASGAGAPFGDGLRCAAANLVRLQVAFSDAAGTSSTSIPIGMKGGVAPGDVKRYQCWYRDTSGSQPCGVGVNDFNLSNGYELVWAP